jgi:hypothetical protein
MREIAISPEGYVIGLSTKKGANGGYLMFKWNAKNEEWTRRKNDFAPEKIAMGKTGWPYALANGGRVFWPQRLCKNEVLTEKDQFPKAQTQKQLGPSPQFTEDPKAPNIIAIQERLPYEYVVRGDRRDMYSAEEQCKKWGGHLSSISSKQEANFIYNMLGPSKEINWIGLRYERKTAQTKWLDGLPSTYEDWLDERPNFSVAGIDCNAIWPSKKWDNISCVEKLPFICKREIPTEQNIPTQVQDKLFE